MLQRTQRPLLMQWYLSQLFLIIFLIKNNHSKSRSINSDVLDYKTIADQNTYIRRITVHNALFPSYGRRGRNSYHVRRRWLVW